MYKSSRTTLLILFYLPYFIASIGPVSAIPPDSIHSTTNKIHPQLYGHRPRSHGFINTKQYADEQLVNAKRLAMQKRLQ